MPKNRLKTAIFFIAFTAILFSFSCESTSDDSDYKGNLIPLDGDSTDKSDSTDAKEDGNLDTENDSDISEKSEEIDGDEDTSEKTDIDVKETENSENVEPEAEKEEWEALKEIDPKLIEIDAGEFKMGVTNKHNVKLTNKFEIMQYEVVQYDFIALTHYNPSTFPGCGGNCPVDNVTKYDAMAFANLFSMQNGLTPCYVFEDVKCKYSMSYVNEITDCFAQNWSITEAKISLENYKTSVYECTGYRLPTEAEWEYAARGETTTDFYTSEGNIGQTIGTPGCYPDESLTKIAIYCGNHEVTYDGCEDKSKEAGDKCAGYNLAGQKAPNQWKLYDMIGNVNEIVWDKYCEYLPQDQTDPEAKDCVAGNLLWRGCAWDNLAERCKSGYRFTKKIGFSEDGLGFRLVRTLPKAK